MPHSKPLSLNRRIIMSKHDSCRLITSIPQEQPQAKPLTVSINNSFAQEEERFLQLIEGISEMAKEISKLKEMNNLLSPESQRIH